MKKLFSQSNRNWAALLALALFSSGCSLFHQPGKEDNPIFTKILRTDYNTGWQSVLESMKSFDRAIVNREAGVIQTAWIDNTAREKNLTDTFGESETFLKSKYRLSVTVAPGTYMGKPSVKISIQKEQMVQKDPLDPWVPLKSNSIEENTLLYRIMRIVQIKLRLKQIEDSKMNELMKDDSATEAGAS